MKIKLSILVSSQPALDSLLQDKTKREIAFSLAHNARIMRDALKPYEDFRKKAIDKYGNKQEDGSIIILANSPEMGKLNKELNEYIGDNELELDLKTVKWEGLPNEISGAVLLDLDWMIESPKEERKRHAPAKPEANK